MVFKLFIIFSLLLRFTELSTSLIAVVTLNINIKQCSVIGICRTYFMPKFNLILADCQKNSQFNNAKMYYLKYFKLKILHYSLNRPYIIQNTKLRMNTSTIWANYSSFPVANQQTFDKLLGDQRVFKALSHETMLCLPWTAF